jgi:cation diffusion facilitator family transporter
LLIVTGPSKTKTSPDVEQMKKRALLLSLIAIISVFAFEFIAGIFTNSLALITDSTHALLDAVVTAILIIAIRLALKPKDIDHTYGHGKIETVGGFIGGIALFVVAVFFIHEAITRILTSSSSTESASIVVIPGTIGFAALIYTLAVDGFRIGILGRAIKKTSTRITGSNTLKADFLHAFADLASTTVAFVGLWLVAIGFGYGDSIAAIILASFLSYLSIRFAYQNAMELTDVISPRLVGSVQQAANQTEGVLRSDDIKMRRVGSEIFVEATIALPAQISFESAHEISAKVENNIAKSLSGAGMRVKPRNITVHFEPVPGTNNMPLELIIESAASRVSGVRGVHNVIISKIANSHTMDVSLHIQVNRSATLTEAHSIANTVEESIKKELASVENITVHLEPVISDVVGMEPIAEGAIHHSIRSSLVGEARGVKKIDRIGIYRTAENTFKIDISCSFSSEMTIEQIHDRVSEIEKEIRTKYPGSIVTIHAEPSY